MAFAGAAGVVRFGAFQFDAVSGELRKGKRPIRVPGQPLCILAILLEKPGEIVSREEIRARLWPNGTIVEFDRSVDSAVKRLRDALQDSAGAPRFIETIPRQGFRFIGQLRQLAVKPGADLLPGRTISHYRILAPAGRGAMGAVYGAEDLTLGRMVALKFLPEELASHPPSLDRLRREARLIAALGHPNICTLYELGEVGMRAFLAMEYLDGESLRQRLTRGRTGQSEFFHIARQVLSGLEAAHAKGIIHRDINPENLFLTHDGKVKILDFGLAKQMPRTTAGGAAESGTEFGTSNPGMPIGTIAYMSPEQIRGEVVDCRSDVFSFGCVLYEMLSGRTPFLGASADSIMQAIRQEAPPPLPGVEPGLECIVRRCLEKDPHMRFQSAADLLRQLQSHTRLSHSELRIHGRHAGNWPLWVLGMMLIATIAGAVGLASRWLSRAQPSLNVSRRFNIVLPVDAPLAPAGLVSPASDCPALALSKDGSRLAYVAQMGGGTRICIRDMRTGNVTPLNGTEGGHTPFFSPDGGSLGFFAQSMLKRIPVQGGTPRVLADAPNPWGAVWGSDDFIYFNRFEAEGIKRVAADGGPIQVCTTAQHFMPELLEGGRYLLVTAVFGTTLIEPGKRPKILTDGFGAHYAPTGHLLYATPGELMAVPVSLSRGEPVGPAVLLASDLRTASFGVAQFSVAQDGTLIYAPGVPQLMTSFMWVERDGRRRSLGLPEEMHHTFDLSPDGRYLAYTSMEGSHSKGWTIWVRDLRTNTKWRLGTRSPSASPPFNVYPRWTPDGKHLLYAQRGKEEYQLVWAAADGGSEPEILWTSGTTGPTYLYPMSFVPDGSVLVAFGLSKDTSIDTYLVPLDPTGRPVPDKMRLFSGRLFAEAFGQISPDGHWLLYSSDESGSYGIYVTPYPKGGVVHQVSKDGGAEPIWNPIAPEILYLRQSRVYSVAVSLGPEFHADPPRFLFEGPFPDVPGFSFDITNDGRRFLMLENPRLFEPTRTLTVVTNVFDELRRRAPSGRLRR